jgi:hypothetical protein
MYSICHHTSFGFNSAIEFCPQWSSSDSNEEGKVFQQKLRVTYLPAEGQALDEEDENPQAGLSVFSDNEPPVSAVSTFPRHMR